MGMNVGGKSGSIQNEINVTPLVDVVLVLLIIFLVTMPILMKRVTLEVPRKIDAETEQIPSGKTITVLVKADLTVVVNDGTKDISIQGVDLAKTLRPLVEEKRTDKIVFVDFEDPVAWGEVVSMMDTIRSLAEDDNHDDVKVALKLKDEAAAPK
jgi:biopolymer transport protein ExbD